MSVHVFFMMSLGLKQDLIVPPGTLARINQHVLDVEEKLGLKVIEADNGDDGRYTHWGWHDDAYRRGFPDVEDDVLCSTVEAHNAWVRRLYDDFGHWAKQPVDGGEIITPADAAKFWRGLHILEVAPERWTRAFYTQRMQATYEVMRGRPVEGYYFDEKPLTEAQAGAVIRLFERFLDNHDCSLEPVHGRDYLASSYDGGYEWCEKCGKGMHPDDGEACRRRKCPLAARARAER